MDKLYRDLLRLDLICQISVGQERFSLTSHFKDFTHYYFSRFVVNLQHVFKDFTGSQIEDFNRRHAEKLSALIKYPNLKADKLIVPIPKGMVYSYRDTLEQLVAVLDTVHAKTIQHDLEQIHDAMGTGNLKTLQIDQVDKKTFEEMRAKIAKLFGKTGLSHSTAVHSLVSPTDIGCVNNQLLESTKTYYPFILALNPLLTKIERRFQQLKFSEKDKDILSAHFMVMAYRLSIMAVVIDHVQGLEHGFVESVTALLSVG